MRVGSVQRGLASMGLVMMAIGIAVLFAFMLTTNGLFEFTVAQTTYNNGRARDMAESAIALGVQALQQAMASGSPAVLTSPSPLTINLVPPQVPSGCQAFLTFNPTPPPGYLQSIYNVSGTSAVPDANGNSVPAGCVEFIGTGQSGASIMRVRALIYTPAFPYVVACSNSFASNGATIAQASGFPSGSPSVAPSVGASAYQPGDVLSDLCLSPDMKLVQTLVTGNAEAVGSICVGAGTTVQGAVEIGVPPVVLPSVNVSSNPECGFGGIQPFPAATGGPLTISGFVAASPSPCAPLTVPCCLTLNGAVLYVHGNLVVNGALNGTGAVYTTGSLTVNGGANLYSNCMMALVAGGTVVLSAPCGQPANFVGLVYTGGDFQASNFHLYGNFVANSPACSAACGGHVTLKNTTVIGMSCVAKGLALAGVTFGGSSHSTQCCGCKTHSYGRCCRVCGWYQGGPSCPNFKGCAAKSFQFTKLPCGGLIVTGPQGSHTYTCCGCRVRAVAHCIINGLRQGAPSQCKCGKTVYCCKNLNCCCAYLSCAELFLLPCCPPTCTLAKGPFYRVSMCQVNCPGVVYHFTFNQFLAPANRTRVLYWGNI